MEKRLANLNVDPGVILRVKVNRVIDGDTVEVEIKRTFHVRFRDFNAPELSDLEGNAYKEKLQKILSEAEEVVIYIPSNDDVRLMDVNSFNRIVADLFVDGINVVELLHKN